MRVHHPRDDLAEQINHVRHQPPVLHGRQNERWSTEAPATLPLDRRLSVASALTSSSAAFAGAAAPAVAQRSAARVAPAMGAKSVDEMIGKYSVKDTVFDPLNLAESYDINWLREAELK